MNKQGFVYIVSNRNRTVLYTGVTSNLEQRVYQHKHFLVAGFSSKYKCTDLVWWCQSDSIASVIAYEKTIKGLSRKRKDKLISELNPSSVDLSRKLFGEDK